MNTVQIEWARTRIRSAAIVNGRYELDVQRETNIGNLLFIPGLTDPVSEIRQLLFGAGKPGGSWIPTLSSAMIAANSFGSGVTDILDLSGNNNPFSQATPSSRSAWFREPKTGRRNLVPVSSETINWGAGTPVTFGAYVNGPFAGMQARQVFGMGESASDDVTAGIIRAIIAGTNTLTAQIGVTYTRSLWIRRITTGSNPGQLRVVGATSATTSSFTVTQEWQRVAVTGTAVTESPLRFILAGGGGADGVLVAGDMLEIGPAPTVFQKVASQFDITEDNQRDCYGVRFDGIDDSAQTGNINLSNTPNATVFLAVRKRSDTTLASFISHNGGADPFFQVRAPSSNGGASFSAVHRGSAAASSSIIGGKPAPVTAILTATFERTLPSLSLQFNNETPVVTTGNIGGGNFANAVLNLGSTSGVTAPCACDVFGAIVVEGVPSVSTANRIRTILSRITPTVIV